MAGFVKEKDRRIIPRWRPFNKTLQLGELSPSEIVKKHSRAPYDLLEKKINDWNKFRTIAYAVDLVGTAGLVLRSCSNDPGINSACEFILRQDVDVSEWTKKIARCILRIPDLMDFAPASGDEYKHVLYGSIRYLKQLLRIQPSDAIAWVEISRCYACLGQIDQAKRCMDIAVKIEKDNRFVIRSASRLWVHCDDIDRAHHTILKSERSIYDPWLLAAEIAI